MELLVCFMVQALRISYSTRFFMGSHRRRLEFSRSNTLVFLEKIPFVGFFFYQKMQRSPATTNVATENIS